MANRIDHTSSPDDERPAARCPRHRAAAPLARRVQIGKRRGHVDKRRGQKDRRRGQEAQKEGVTVKRTWSDGKRRWDKKHYCVFCQRPQVKIARHLLRKHTDQEEVSAASMLPTGSKQRHLLLEHLRCRGNYLHNIEVIRQGSGEIIPWRQPSEEVDVRNYLPCPLCLGFFIRADLWKHQASCRKKMTSDPLKETNSGNSACEPADNSTSNSTEDTPSDPLGDRTGTKQPMTSDPTDPNMNSELGVDRPRKRIRVQAAASRLLPISSGASESCSEILHRMNQDHVSHQVKSDWLICKYGNKLMGTQDGSQRRYDYVSQKLRELGRLLLAAKSLNSGIQTLQDLLAPGCLSLALSAAKKASGYRWSCPPLAVKSTLKTVCELAINESLQEGDWEAAGKATDFFHQLGKEWGNLGLLNPKTPTDTPVRGAKLKKQMIRSESDKERNEAGQDQSEQRLEVPSQSGNQPLASMIPPDCRLQIPFTAPVVPGKVPRRPWSCAEKEAVWRQLGVHILMQSVPGKDVCQHCLDLEPVLRGRHWKDIKNQVHNQIQSHKKQQFHVQVELEGHQEPQDQVQNQKKQQRYQTQMNKQGNDHNQRKHQYHTQMDQQDQNKKKQQYDTQMKTQEQDNIQNQKKQQYHNQMDQQDHLDLPKKPLCHARLDQLDHIQVHKKQLYQMDEPSTVHRDSSMLAGMLYGRDRPHQALDQSLLERNPAISQYLLPHQTLGPHMEQLLSRTEWPEECLSQNYSASRQIDRTLLQDGQPVGQAVGQQANPHSGHVHF